MGKEWLHVAASAGMGESMLLMARVLGREGKTEAGMGWLGRAEEVEGVKERAREMKGKWEAEGKGTAIP